MIPYVWQKSLPKGDFLKFSLSPPLAKEEEKEPLGANFLKFPPKSLFPLSGNRFGWDQVSLEVPGSYTVCQKFFLIYPPP
jgi:hypothetical protein